MDIIYNMDNLVKSKELLLANNYTCVVCKGDEIYTSNFRGVKPLVVWYAQNKIFTDFSASDKVIGKATAFLYVLLNVKAIYAKVISKPALQVLQDNNIYIEYDELVENIINRKGDGICPFEEVVSNIKDKHEAYKLIRQKMIDLNIDI